MNPRRRFFRSVLGLGAGAAARSRLCAQVSKAQPVHPALPVLTPDISDLPFTVDNGVNEGDRIRIVFENHLPEPTGVHWHGLELPTEMDGVPGIGQKPVMPGERFVYEFPLHQNGTFFYHSHKAEMLPRAEQAYRLYQTSYQKMASAYPQVLISQRTLFQLEAEYVQALENAWQSSLAIRGFGLMDGLSEPKRNYP